MSGVAVLLLTAIAALVPGRTAPAQIDPASGDPVAALAEARAAVERAPLELGPVLDLARAFTALGRSEDALSAFARARELAPVGANSSGTASAGAGEQASAYLVPALLLRDLDRTGEAIRLLEAAADLRLGSADIYEQLALLRLADGLVDGALAAVDAAVAESLESPGLDLARGLALARDPDRRVEALSYLQRALDAGEGDRVVVHLETADILAAEGRFSEAVEHLRAAAESAPEEPEVVYRLGRTLAAAGDRESARAALDSHRSLVEDRERAAEAERLASARTASALSDAQRFAEEGDLEAALERLEGLSGGSEDSWAADVHSLRAKVLFSMGRVDEAAASVAEARNLEPNQVEHHYLEGMFLHTGRRAEDAAVALERALALDPGLAEAHALLGMIAAEAGRPAVAAERMERALQLGLDNNAPLRFNYARVLEALGRTEEAKVQMEAFERLRQRPAQ
ncbi:MAG: tetratricopeptide repeat protein [Holophagales bacterium]|nr:tetratricopeptide repeat protein [Holophagales bacterium]MYF97330.1 tetratricopeptide repeat protein [Holophagales bacterium]